MRWLVVLAYFLAGLLVQVGGQTCACQSPGGCNFAEVCLPVGSCNRRNEALGKPATMSSAYNNAIKNLRSGPACLAVDGNVDTEFRPINIHPRNPNCVHTADNDKSPSWEVDLGQNYAILTITIFARNGQLIRMSSVHLTVDGVELYTFPVQGISLKTEIPFDPPVSGRVVRLTRNIASLDDKDPFLDFCELQVWVCETGWEGPTCERSVPRTTSDQSVHGTTTTSIARTTTTTPKPANPPKSGTSAAAIAWITILLTTLAPLL